MIAAWRSTTDRKTPRFKRRLVSVAKKVSTALSQEHEVGVEVACSSPPKSCDHTPAPMFKPTLAAISSRVSSCWPETAAADPAAEVKHAVVLRRAIWRLEPPRHQLDTQALSRKVPRGLIADR